jgi:hypothetical protein
MSSSLVKNMESCKETYYINENKNSFFKKNQKNECAKKVSESFPLDDMINKTIYVIPNTNKIFIDYTIFKLFGVEGNYDNIIEKVLFYYDELMIQYGGYEVHINLQSFSITSAERYKNIISLFYETSNKVNINYTKYLIGMYIYYTPSMMDIISKLLKPFIDPIIISKIIYIQKKESESSLKQLFDII